jgi:hypothetical protein
VFTRIRPHQPDDIPRAPLAANESEAARTIAQTITDLYEQMRKFREKFDQEKDAVEPVEEVVVDVDSVENPKEDPTCEEPEAMPENIKYDGIEERDEEVRDSD